MITLKNLFTFFLCAIIFCCINTQGYAFFLDFSEDQLDAMTSEERKNANALAEFEWHEEGTMQMPISNSSLTIPQGYLLLVGNDARKNNVLNNNTPDETLEAISYYDDFTNPVYISSINDGFVSLDDWEEINATELLKSISENTEAANRQLNLPENDKLHIGNWIQMPTLDRTSYTVYWAFDAHTINGGDIVNSTALKLGRNGYERFVWATDKESYIPFGGALDQMIKAHQFEPGLNYTDFKKGDKIAEYGIAALITAAAGGKFIQAGGFLILKKGIGFIIAAIGGLLYKFKNIFKRKKETQNP